MIIVKFCRNYKSNYVGWCEYENGHYFTSGHTLDILVRNMKAQMYQKKRISSTQIILDSKPSDGSDCPVQYMSNMFRGKQWKHFPDSKEESKPQEKFDSHEYVVENGKLIVYGIRKVKVAEFDNVGAQDE